MSDIHTMKLPGLSLFLCRPMFQDRPAFAHVFDDGAADRYLGGVRSTVGQAFVSEA